MKQKNAPKRGTILCLGKVYHLGVSAWEVYHLGVYHYTVGIFTITCMTPQNKWQGSKGFVGAMPFLC